MVAFFEFLFAHAQHCSYHRQFHRCNEHDTRKKLREYAPCRRAFFPRLPYMPEFRTLVGFCFTTKGGTTNSQLQLTIKVS